MRKPENVTDEAWQAAVMKARRDPHRARALLQRGLLMRTRGPALRLPETTNPTIRPNRKKQQRRKKRR